MGTLATIKNLLFRLRYGFRGVPITFQGRVLRLDESLRRWNPSGEKEVQAVICQHLRPGDVFVDVEANFGMHALLGASCVESIGHVYAIEPVPFNHRQFPLLYSMNASKIGSSRSTLSKLMLKAQSILSCVVPDKSSRKTVRCCLSKFILSRYLRSVVPPKCCAANWANWDIGNN